MKNLLIIPLMCFAFLFQGCNKLIEEVVPNEGRKNEEGYSMYLIKQGQHTSGVKYRGFNHNRMSFKAVFDSSAVYKTEKGNNQGDINKLYGFSDCGTKHQQNSARFGWRWTKGQLQIHAYTYVNGERSSSFIKAVELDQENDYSIEIINNKYVFQVDGQRVEMNRGCDSENASGYILWPYFGGDEVAPHNIIVKIKEN